MSMWVFTSHLACGSVAPAHEADHEYEVNEMHVQRRWYIGSGIHEGVIVFSATRSIYVTSVTSSFVCSIRSR